VPCPKSFRFSGLCLLLFFYHLAVMCSRPRHSFNLLLLPTTFSPTWPRLARSRPRIQHYSAHVRCPLHSNRPHPDRSDSSTSRQAPNNTYKVQEHGKQGCLLLQQGLNTICRSHPTILLRYCHLVMPARLAATLLLHDSHISAFHAAIFNLVWVVPTNAIDSASTCRTPACRKSPPS